MRITDRLKKQKAEEIEEQLGRYTPQYILYAHIHNRNNPILTFANNY